MHLGGTNFCLVLIIRISVLFVFTDYPVKIIGIKAVKPFCNAVYQLRSVRIALAVKGQPCDLGVMSEGKAYKSAAPISSILSLPTFYLRTFLPVRS